jgi:riboflavin kinase / FMN adenylyltransferase
MTPHGVKLIRDLAELPDALRGGAVAIGNFDGVHLGHATIAGRLVAAARAVGGPAVVFTFDPHPVRILRPEAAPPPLTWTDRKVELLGKLGVDAVIAYPTDTALLDLSAEDFFQKIVVDRLAAREIVEGTNFYFGHGRSGTIDVLRRLSSGAGFGLNVVEPVVIGGQPVSSSRVRKLLAEGSVDEARALLTQPYRLRGMVRHGAGRGAKLGFPTANVDAIDTLLPGPGVYAGRAMAGGSLWPAAINIGPNPTFGEQAMKVEVHLIGFHGSLYGEPLEVDFLSRLRDIQRFDNVPALLAQIQTDVAEAKRRVGSELAAERHGGRSLQ